MRFATIQSLQRLLLVNWAVWLGLPAWILFRLGFGSALVFVVAWLILDKIWDFLTTLLMTGVGALGGTEREALAMQLAGKFPLRVAGAMLIDLLGTLLLPWFLAGLLLEWFHA